MSVGRQKLKLPSISNDQSCERISVKSRPGRERVQCVQHENQFALLSDENVQNTGATLSSCVEASNLVIAPDDSSLAVACTACTDKVSGCTAPVQGDVSAV